jgi:hypothetical protein
MTGDERKGAGFVGGGINGTELMDHNKEDLGGASGSPPAGGETVGSGAARGDVGSGTPSDKGELGGGGGGTGPAGTGSPGGDSRA